MLRILFIGDIVGSIGRKTVAALLPKLKRQEKIDIVIANAENSAHGSGITETTIEELQAAGVDFFTNGDHALRRKGQEKLYEHPYILRPANLPPVCPGHGFAVLPYRDSNILLINLVGRVYMQANYDCPFRKLDEILANPDLLAKNISAIIVDMHAEASSEKAAFYHYASGRVSAVLGTHTHVQTADEKIGPQGTAFITDVGMCGADDSSLGIAKEGAIRNFLTQMKEKHVLPEKGPAIFNALRLDISAKQRSSRSIKRISIKTEIR